MRRLIARFESWWARATGLTPVVVYAIGFVLLAFVFWLLLIRLGR